MLTCMRYSSGKRACRAKRADIGRRGSCLTLRRRINRHSVGVASDTYRWLVVAGRKAALTGSRQAKPDRAVIRSVVGIWEAEASATAGLSEICIKCAAHRHHFTFQLPNESR
jgi:hypothetical protein